MFQLKSKEQHKTNKQNAETAWNILPSKNTTQ